MKPSEELSDKIRDIMSDDKQSRDEKIEEIKGIYDYARAEQRAAIESMMVSDDGLNEALQSAEKALEELGAGSPVEEDENSAATL